MEMRGKADLARFGRLVKARRDALGLTQEEVSALGGPSDTTFTKIENLTWRPGRQNTLRKIDAGLKWEPGSSARILYENGDPTPLPSTPAQPSDGPIDIAHMAIEIAVYLEAGVGGLWKALEGLELPPETAVALKELDAAAYRAEGLAIQLAGPDLAQRRRQIRARVEDLMSEVVPSEIPYLSNGRLDPKRTSGYVLDDAEMAERAEHFDPRRD